MDALPTSRAEHAAFASSTSIETRFPSFIPPTPCPQSVAVSPASPSEEMLNLVLRVLCDAGRLTPVRADVLRLALLGRQYSEIAEVLGKSPNTVATQVKAILKSLGADSTRDLFRIFLTELDAHVDRGSSAIRLT